MQVFLKNLRNDLPAGLVVFFVALPLCLGISLASGAPLFSGLISGFIGGIVVGFFSGSNLSVSGPAAGLATIVLAAITSLNDFNSFLLAIFIAGVIQLILGWAKAGFIAVYFPNAVIKGMLAAIGIILILKQIPHAFGYDKDFEGDLNFVQSDKQNTFSELLEMLNYVHLGAIIIAALSFLIIWIWEKDFIKRNSILKFVPGSLIAVTIGIFCNVIYSAYFPFLSLRGEHLVSLPEMSSYASFFNEFKMADFSQITNVKVLGVAFTIAIVASIESLLSIEASDKLDPHKNVTPPNRELIAQGLGNMTAGLLGGLPVTAVIVRSSANINSGAKSKTSTIFHGFLLLFSILFARDILVMIPLSSLAAILIMVGYKLSKIKLFTDTYKMGFDQFAPFVVTIIGVVFSDLLKGIGIGIVISIIFILRNNYKLPFTLKKIEDNGKQIFFIKLSQNVTFLNKGKVQSILLAIPDGAEVMIDGGRSTFIDKDVLEIISDFKEAAEFKNIKVITEEIPEVATLSTH